MLISRTQSNNDWINQSLFNQVNRSLIHWPMIALIARTHPSSQHWHSKQVGKPTSTISQQFSKSLSCIASSLALDDPVALPVHDIFALPVEAVCGWARGEDLPFVPRASSVTAPLDNRLTTATASESYPKPNESSSPPPPAHRVRYCLNPTAALALEG